jgi:hypothetical protein
MPDAVRPPRGRPRKFATSVERIRDLRTKHNLRKVTVDVPEATVDLLKFYSQWLRKMYSKDVDVEWMTKFSRYRTNVPWFEKNIGQYLHYGYNKI